MGNFLAKQIKDQTDSILRRRQVSPGSSMTVRGGATTPGTGPGTPPEVVEPNRDLARHKTSADHDGRYYTEAEVDALLASRAAVFFRDDFINTDTIVVAHNLGKRPITQVIGRDDSVYGPGLYGAGVYGGIGDETVLAPLSIAHDSLNQITVTLEAAKSGEVICIG